jgi:hypothetical protein
MVIPPVGTESETPRDGVLSTLTEYHALILGCVVGFVALLTGALWLLVVFVAGALGMEAGRRRGSSSRVPAFGEVTKEPWYGLGGLVIGMAAEHYGPALLDALLWVFEAAVI